MVVKLLLVLVLVLLMINYEVPCIQNGEILSLSIYPTGKVGDWKNWFTVAQSEQFDAAFEQQVKGTRAFELYSNKQALGEPDSNRNEK